MEVKDWFERMPLSKDAVHIYAAVFIQVTASLTLRRPLGNLLPWLIVLGADLANEGLDIVLGEEDQVQPWQVAGALHDLVNTMFMPSILVLLVRYLPTLFVLPVAVGSEDEMSPG